jgi:hypothetical protein
MRRSRHRPRSTPISVSNIFIQLACLGVMKLQPLKNAVCFQQLKRRTGDLGTVPTAKSGVCSTRA